MSTAWLRETTVAISRHSDLLLAGLVVGIVAMMIIPLPTFLLDLLLTLNISIAVILLLVSIYVANALRIAAFPSILLITTLYRLGLNVSSTRLILLQADAGTVIASFGSFVVAGNLVVGAVIFLILTLIQFIVIAKGSERVAEVAARFTLDAMPGKQMAIDADVRAGAVEIDEARRLRALLQQESQLYGSMDGAMKFVKGDAIAGVLITLINIVGGLLIGVLQRGMSLGEATHVYSLLTIGDGLVSQIPALLISTSAGIVVTRVASEDEGAHLGRDIAAQVLAQPRAIAIAAGLLLLLAIVPGLPTVPFLLLGGAVGGVAYALRSVRRPGAVRHHPQGAVSSSPLGGRKTEQSRALPPTSAVTLEVGDALLSFVDTEGNGSRIMSELIPGLREMLYADRGVVLPGVHVRGAGETLAASEYQISIAETPVVRAAIDPGRVLVLAEHDQLAALGVDDLEAVEAPGVASPCFSVAVEWVSTVAATDFQRVDPATQMVLHLGQVLQQHAAELVGIQETQELLDALERSHPALVHEVVPKLVTVQTLSEVLRRLVQEEVSIRDLRGVLQALAEWAPGEKDALVLTEYVRMGLRRQLSHRYAGPKGELVAWMLDPTIEDVVRDAIQRTDKGSYLALEPQIGQDIVAAVEARVGQIAPSGALPVVLTSAELRRYVRRLLESDLPRLPVLSYNDLLPSVSVQPLGRISVAAVE